MTALYRSTGIDRDRNVDNLLSRTVFTNVVNYFTRPERKSKSCVDNVLDSLVYENVANVGRVVGGEVRGVAERRSFIVQLAGIEQYLKFAVVAHIGGDGAIFYTSGRYLHTNPLYADRTTRKSPCKQCLLP